MHQDYTKILLLTDIDIAVYKNTSNTRTQNFN